VSKDSKKPTLGEEIAALNDALLAGTLDIAAHGLAKPPKYKYGYIDEETGAWRPKRLRNQPAEPDIHTRTARQMLPTRHPAMIPPQGGASDYVQRGFASALIDHLLYNDLLYNDLALGVGYGSDLHNLIGSRRMLSVDVETSPLGYARETDTWLHATGLEQPFASHDYVYLMTSRLGGSQSDPEDELPHPMEEVAGAD